MIVITEWLPWWLYFAMILFMIKIAMMVDWYGDVGNNDEIILTVVLYLGYL